MRYKIEMAYNGTNYHGWQVQPNAITVQEVINKCLSMLLHVPVETVRASAEDMQASVKAAQVFEVFEETVQASAETAHATVDLAKLEAGDLVQPIQITGSVGELFQAYEIHRDDAVFARINGKSYIENPDISLEDLRYIKLVHYNFQHDIQVGEMIVNRAVCDDVLSIFQELFLAHYEICSVYLIDNFWTGDGGSSDTASIEHNNTSCFCYRTVTGGSRLSNHALGRAIDINPQQNPYVWFDGGTKRYAHANAAPYVDRTIADPHVIMQNDFCWKVFRQHGFNWGGEWSAPVDYQHFEKPG